ncbi:response regulator [Chloroflexus sp.]|uniref:response regulator n=1 Tax=Chloroflexus sp. TaxID=1904827 RepID=UPI00260377C6|nr:response regulator [uncultured Chloroflexus sp.]
MTPATPKLRRRLAAGLISVIACVLLVSIVIFWRYATLNQQANHRLQQVAQALEATQQLNIALLTAQLHDHLLIEAAAHHRSVDPQTIVNYTTSILNALQAQAKLSALSADIPSLAALEQQIAHLIWQYQTTFYQIAFQLEQRRPDQLIERLQAARQQLAAILSHNEPDLRELERKLGLAEFAYLTGRQPEHIDDVLDLLNQLEAAATNALAAESFTAQQSIADYRNTLLQLIEFERELAISSGNLHKHLDTLLHTIEEAALIAATEQAQITVLLEQATFIAYGLIFWMIGSSAAIFIALGWLIHRYFTRPLITLTAAARRVSSGWRDTPIPLIGTDEIGELARALARLTADLNDTIAHLEERVNQRTAQLQRTLANNEALLARERRRSRGEQVLIDLSLVLSGLNDEGTIYRRLVETLATGKEPDDRIGVYVRDSDGFWSPRATDGYRHNPLLKLSAPPLLMTGSGSPFYIDDLSQHQIKSLPYAQGSAIVAIIHCHEQPHALLVIYRPQPNAFTNDEIANLNIAAQLAGHAITRGHLMASLQQAKEIAESVNRERMAFLARFDQVVRHRLNIIVSIGEVLHEALAGQPAAAEDAAKIMRAGRQLLAQLNILLDSAKIEAGTLALQPEPFAIDSLLDDVLNEIKPLIDSNYNRLVINRSPHSGMIVADLQRLRQILIHPLRFAAATTHRGVVTVQARRFTVADQGTFFELVISDTGPALSESHLRALLTPFALSPAEPRRSDESTGVALSCRLCELMGGTLSARSEHPGGLTFTIRIPITFPQTSEDGPISTSALPQPDLVLITATEAHTLQSALEQVGWHARQTASLEEAIAHLHRPPVALLIDLPPDRASTEAMLHAAGWLQVPIVWLAPTDEGEPGTGRAVWPGEATAVVETLHSLIARSQSTASSILVIEDEVSTRLMIRRVLEREGWNVIEAGSVAVGAMLWRNARPKLVILDLMLPDGDGIDLLRELRSELSTPVIVVTARSLQADELSVLARCGAVVLYKGRYRRDELLAYVRKLAQ